MRELKKKSLVSALIACVNKSDRGRNRCGETNRNNQLNGFWDQNCRFNQNILKMSFYIIIHWGKRGYPAVWLVAVSHVFLFLCTRGRHCTETYAWVGGNNVCTVVTPGERIWVSPLLRLLLVKFRRSSLVKTGHTWSHVAIPCGNVWSFSLILQGSI